MELLILIPLAMLVTTIGALPLGLVNLTVLNIAIHKGNRQAMHVAHGAAWMEVVFGVCAILFGSFFSLLAGHYQFVNDYIMVLPAVIGFYFLIKKETKKDQTQMVQKGFFNGMFLNLISIQVLLYWVMAISWLNSQETYIQTIPAIILFAFGIWIGKMGVLWVYAHFSQKIVSKFQFLAKNINRLIGSILIATVLIHFVK